MEAQERLWKLKQCLSELEFLPESSSVSREGIRRERYEKGAIEVFVSSYEIENDNSADREIQHITVEKEAPVKNVFDPTPEEVGLV